MRIWTTVCLCEVRESVCQIRVNVHVISVSKCEGSGRGGGRTIDEIRSRLETAREVREAKGHTDTEDIL